MTDRKNRITVIFGKKGYGKTYHMKELSLIEKRIIIADPVDTFLGGLLVYSFVEYMSTIDKFLERDQFRIVCKFSTMREYDQMFDHIFTLSSLTLAIDETNMFARPNSILDSLHRLVSFGRQRNISIIACARRPYELHRIFTSQSDMIVSFRQSEKRDLKFMEELGFNTDRLRSLPKFSYLAQSTE